MARRAPRNAVVYEDEHMRVTRYHGRGRKDPSGVRIEMLDEIGDPQRNGWRNRIIKITLDELYDLTEVLDDLCDQIEDQITEHEEK